jgi:hypothetical protein
MMHKIIYLGGGLMNEIGVLDRIIIDALFIEFKKSHYPQATSVLRTFHDIVQRQCYDMIYQEIDFKSVDEEKIHSILQMWFCCHSYGGTIYNESQNRLFTGWFDSTKLLGG